MKISIKKGIAGIGFIAFALTSCNSDKTTPGYTFMDDMYVSPSLETYGANDKLPEGMVTMTPVEGTISRDHLPYEFENTNEGYEAARVGLMIPSEYSTKESLKGSKDLYNKMCSHCHGTKGDGNGTLAQREKFLGIPSYEKAKLANITPGSIYHVVMHGKGMMGSHASQLTEEERWKIVSYVWYDLRGEAEGSGAEMASVETEKTVAANAEDVNLETVVSEENSH